MTAVPIAVSVPSVALNRVIVRRATPDDRDAIRAQLIECWHAAYDDIMGPEMVTAKCDHYFAPNVLDYIIADDPLGWTGVVEFNGVIVATGCFRIKPLGRASLGMLYVSPGWHRRGFGTAIIDQIPQIFPWANSIEVEALQPNRAGIAFYEARGFRKVWEGHDYVRIPIRLVELRRPLAGGGHRLQALLHFLRLLIGPLITRRLR